MLARHQLECSSIPFKPGNTDKEQNICKPLWDQPLQCLDLILACEEDKDVPRRLVHMDLQDRAQRRIKVAVNWLWHIQHLHRILPALHSIALSLGCKAFSFAERYLECQKRMLLSALHNETTALMAASMDLQIDYFGPVEEVRKFSSIKCGGHDYELQSAFPLFLHRHR